MSVTLGLIGLYAASVASKTKRRNVAAQQESKAKSAVHNWAKGPKGIRKIPNNADGAGGNLLEGESLYGFTIGRDTKMNKITEPNMDLYENPSNPQGPLITKNQFVSMNAKTSGLEGTTDLKLGARVGQQNPVDGKLSFLPGYVRFPKKVDVEKTNQVEGRMVNGTFVPKKPNDKWVATHGQEQIMSATKSSFSRPYRLEEKVTQEIKTPEYGYMNAQNMFVPMGKDKKSFEDGVTQRATHTRIVTKVGEKVVETTIASPISETKKASEVQATVRYLDADGQVTTSDNAVTFEKVKILNGNLEVVDEAKPINKLANQTVVTLFNADGNVTFDRKEAVTQKQSEFDSDGLLIKEGLTQEYKQPKAAAVRKATEYIIRVEGIDKKITRGINTTLGISEAEVQAGVTKDGRRVVAIEQRTYNKDNVAGEFTPYNSDGAAKASNDAKDGNTTGTIVLKSNENDPTTFGKKNITINMDRRKSGPENLGVFNQAIIDNPSILNEINTNKDKYDNAASIISREAYRFFNEGRVGKEGIAIYPNLPKNPTDALTKLSSSGLLIELSKIKNFEAIVVNAARMLGEKEQQDLLKFSPRKEGESITILKGTNEKGATSYIAASYPTEFENVVENVLVQYVKSTSDPDAIKAVIASLIKSKTKNDGTPEFEVGKDGKSRRVLDPNQPLLSFVKDLHSKAIIGKKVTMNGVTRDATYLDAFFSIMHPYPKQSAVGSVIGDDRQYILDKFNVIATNNFKEASNLIMGFTDINQSMVDNIIEELHGGDTSNIKVRQEINGKSTSAFNAIITIDSMEGTYTVNGKDIDINTQQGEMIVKFAGAYETGKRVFRFFKGAKLMDIVSSSVEEVNDALIDQSEVYESVNSSDPLEMAAKSKNREALANIKRMVGGDLGNDGSLLKGGSYLNEKSAFVKTLPDSMQKAYASGKLGNEIIRKLAIRQYHKYMLAYQLAAAIQGGTGGRTISDQDVQNILSALNFGFFTEAKLERETLREAKKMMTSIYEYNTALLSKDTRVQYAAIKARQMLFEGKKGGYLGIGNKDGMLGIKARRGFIVNKLLNTKYSGGNASGDKKIDKEQTREANELMENIKKNKE